MTDTPLALTYDEASDFIVGSVVRRLADPERECVIDGIRVASDEIAFDLRGVGWTPHATCFAVLVLEVPLADDSLEPAVVEIDAPPADIKG